MIQPAQHDVQCGSTPLKYQAPHDGWATPSRENPKYPVAGRRLG